MKFLTKTLDRYMSNKIDLAKVIDLCKYHHEVAELFQNKDFLSFAYVHEPLQKLSKIFDQLKHHDVLFKCISEYGVLDENEFKSFCLEHMSNLESFTEFYNFFENKTIQAFVLDKLFDEFLEVCENKFEFVEYFINRWSENFKIDDRMQERYKKLGDSIENIADLQVVALSQVGDYGFEHWLFDVQTIEKFEELCTLESEWLRAKERNIHNFEEFLAFYSKNSNAVQSYQMFLKTQEYCCSAENFEKLVQYVQNDIKALNMLKGLIDSAVLETFDSFDDLMKYLAKKDKKTSLSI